MYDLEADEHAELRAQLGTRLENPLEELQGKVNKIVGKTEQDRLIKVPQKFDRAAKQILKGNSTGKVSRNSGGKLSKWAQQQRRKNNG